ncbi:hypothetical protein RHGRI_007198 [Rhododendron griersonianum]|uniref:Demeter RRM-fold domain-containing protein n=1 Tax=Rhododendron griersonianum TaxID=479676 RepID=A0AAV6KWS6_9ERIC|nr:hypothetical protein RHGRI_007198 [Rhododendron griersonianum]
MSKAFVAFYPQAASIPTPKLKNVSRLRTEHQVYELPDPHPLLNELDKRELDDPSPYLLAIWTPGEAANSIQLPEGRCGSQESGKLCNEKNIPCRTAMRRSFPLNGTYFQVNEAFVLSALTATSSRSFAIRAILWFFLSSASGLVKSPGTIYGEFHDLVELFRIGGKTMLSLCLPAQFMMSLKRLLFHLLPRRPKVLRPRPPQPPPPLNQAMRKKCSSKNLPRKASRPLQVLLVPPPSRQTKKNLSVSGKRVKIASPKKKKLKDLEDTGTTEKTEASKAETETSEEDTEKTPTSKGTPQAQSQAGVSQVQSPVEKMSPIIDLDDESFEKFFENNAKQERTALTSSIESFNSQIESLEAQKKEAKEKLADLSKREASLDQQKQELLKDSKDSQAKLEPLVAEHPSILALKEKAKNTINSVMTAWDTLKANIGDELEIPPSLRHVYVCVA